MKIIRMTSFIAACVWNFIFFFAIFWLLDYVDDWGGRPIEPGEFFVAMVIAYNVILHFGVAIINSVIILKEISLEYI